MDQNVEYRQQLLEEYKKVAMPLLRYLPWMEKNKGQTASALYQGEESGEGAMQFPVYDSTLMSFVKEAFKSPLMDRNYHYVYSRNRIRTHEDERRMITSAELNDWDILRGILSKYVMGGMTKGALWSEAMQENIFYLVLKQMHKIIEFWDKPFDIR